tara:strand:- start:856 stop:1356 length:501 start_codon:yes stop_codon:yes gene_type:complete
VKQASAYTDYQSLAAEFAVGDRVIPFGHDADAEGTIVALYPAIGMADVQTSVGAQRFPVEDLQRLNSTGARSAPIETESVPGGAGSVPKKASPSKVALYWKNRDRKYHATRGECEGGQYNCPKCKGHHLKPAIYKRREGLSERLLACPSCLFLIKDLDIHLHSGGE